MHALQRGSGQWPAPARASSRRAVLRAAIAGQNLLDERQSEFGERPVLTVGESIEPLALGGLIKFQFENDRVAFEFSAEKGVSSPARLNSQPRNLGRVVQTQGGRPNG